MRSSLSSVRSSQGYHRTQADIDVGLATLVHVLHVKLLSLFLVHLIILPLLSDARRQARTMLLLRLFATSYAPSRGHAEILSMSARYVCHFTVKRTLNRFYAGALSFRRLRALSTDRDGQMLLRRRDQSGGVWLAANASDNVREHGGGG